MLYQFIELQAGCRGRVINPAMVTLFKVCKTVMIQSFAEKFKLRDIMSFGLVFIHNASPS